MAEDAHVASPEQVVVVAEVKTANTKVKEEGNSSHNSRRNSVLHHSSSSSRSLARAAHSTKEG